MSSDGRVFINDQRVWAFVPVVETDGFVGVPYVARYFIVAESPYVSGEYLSAQLNSLADDEWYASENHPTLDRALVSMYRRAGVIGKWMENRAS
jgi:hypothetical protein